ncbi:anthranilate synthase component I [Candidatus Spongiihabitans sp.]|uniref:anthranilate synthase component I n=1 Tax=Candidatus Spongiihabitans sp. TaxID=3101308 RepID=UPI003C7B3EA3
MLNKQQFNQFAEAGFNRIPLVREILADMETPLSVYRKLADAPFSYMLESVQGGEKWGRYSIIGVPCRNRLEVKGKTLSLFEDGRLTEKRQCDDPLDEVRQFHNRYSVPELPELPRFTGGLVGYFGYDTVGYIEPHLGANPVKDPIDAPDILLMVSEELVVFDNLAGRLYVIIHVDPKTDQAWETGKRRLQALIAQLHSAPPHQSAANNEAASVESATDESRFLSSFPQPEYEAAVAKCKQYIYDGDAFQIVISQRLSLPFAAAPLDLYRALRTLNPSPYMYYLNLGDFHIAGASPEILVRVENGEITLRPIAGTRLRGDDDEQDAALAAELLADPKELAEHLMLIDLGRNDVGRVSKVGTVTVTDKMTIEKYSHVMHIVSNITGQINDSLNAIDVLKATFPAGTLSGAPKVRAMEIIEDIEPDKRGIYSGAIGYIGWNGNMDTAIAIRTALIKEQTVYIQAGAGIVADSDPACEWEETMNKGRAIFKAVEMVNAGLHNPLDSLDSEA